MQLIWRRITKYTLKYVVIRKQICSNALDFCLQNGVLSKCLRMGNRETHGSSFVY
jgi:hypothetical protein